LISNKPAKNNCFIKNVTTLKKKNQERKGKKEKRDKKGTRIDHMTERKRRQNLASVLLRFLAKLNESMKAAPK